MRQEAKVVVVLSVLVLIAVLGSTHRIVRAQQGTAEQQSTQLERDWCMATVKGDAAVHGRILADDFTIVGSRGIVETKTDTLADLKDKTSAVTECVDRSVKVRLYGDAAFVTGLGTRSGKYKGACSLTGKCSGQTRSSGGTGGGNP